MDKVDPSAASLLNIPFNQGLNPAGLRQGRDTKKARGKEQLRQSRKTLFSEILENSVQPTADLGPLKELAPSEEALTELMDTVHSAGNALKEKPFPDEILSFKKAVRNFIHYVIENGYEIQKVKGLKKKTVIRGETEWKDVVYHQVRIIDQKLEELAAAILSGQTDQLLRVSKLDEITGLLVDLTVTGMIKERDE